MFNLSKFKLTLIVWEGGGGKTPHATQNLEEKKCPCWQNNKTVLIKQIYGVNCPTPRNTNKDYLTPILLGLRQNSGAGNKEKLINTSNLE